MQQLSFPACGMVSIQSCLFYNGFPHSSLSGRSVQMVVSPILKGALAGGLVGATVAIAGRLLEGPESKDPKSWPDTLRHVSRAGSCGALVGGCFAASLILYFQVLMGTFELIEK